ncbi:hypothetical protein B9T31_07695 [Acinetobacter sp. ANC 4558]|uniref:hypothetical protein n=1 Tax=Acinetobacter sp. ANC 4558 TaxID=1977876 RepID=UPI000A331D33|nr:hypothetical protein [Acinetobacter sp. ANC 4558]OTG86374.1 hypothetical protein B9T31_07695 [Acinetobacter sp. ANC 4558]
MKLKVALLSLVCGTSCFASVEIMNEQMLVGTWSCSSSFFMGNLQVTELSETTLNDNGTSIQKGITYYKASDGEATLKYDVASEWTMLGNKIKFSKLKINNYSISNHHFDQTYQISSTLLSLGNKINSYTILKFNNRELIIKPDDYDLKETCQR